MTEYTKGTKSYLDAFISGIIKCVVTSVASDRVYVKFEETKGGYSKGEECSFQHSQVFPRKHLVKRGIYLRVNTQYKWV